MYARIPGAAVADPCWPLLDQRFLRQHEPDEALQNQLIT
jgi:hypothetical protein